jgi:hypothetical protein
LASSISAKPLDDNAESCPFFCWIDNNCIDCTWGKCVSISSSFPAVDVECDSLPDVSYFLSVQ